jgi:hypothetical protein
MRRAVLVNGVPASGKSTLAAPLAAALTARGAPAALFALDTVKEALFTEIGAGDREYNRMLGRASYRAIFDTVAGFDDRLLPVIDAWHGFQPVDVLQGHLARARIGRVVEIWVAVAPELAAERYRARAATRPTGHLPASYAEELRALAARATPLGLGPVITVDGAGAADQDLAARVLAALDAGAG